ncbi:UNVERIFIED_CONTAM: hypothetical protein BEN50_14625 [Euhalothece sp. KZN 001]
MTANANPSNAEYDSPWKEALERYLPAFLALCFPSLHHLIDWSQPYLSLDTELREAVRDADLGTRFADKLFQVFLNDGSVTQLLIHLEVQGQYEANFSERMFVYHYRIFDRCRSPLVSLAVLGDDRPSWRPNSYGYGEGGAQMKLEFLIVKLLDFEEQWQELESSDNLFAPIIMAHLKSKSTTQDAQARAQWKWTIVRGLYQRGYQRGDILELFRVIDWMMVLPEALQEEFNDQVKQETEETQMPLLSHLELEAKAEGRKEGRKEGQKEEKQAVALNFLRMGLSPEQVAQGTGLSLEKIQELQSQLEGES